MKKLSLLLLFCLAIFTMDAQQLEVSPVKLMFDLETGNSGTKQVSVRNKSDVEQSYVFSVADWMVDENGETHYFPAGTTKRSCANWITITPNLITLQPNATAKVNVTMLVPNNDASTKWAMIYVEIAKEKTGAEAIDKKLAMGIQVSPRIGLQVFQSPPSNTLYKGTIDNLKEIPVEEGQPRKFSADVINLGDKILNCKVYFMVSNLQTAEETTSEATEFSLLPESQRNLDYTLDQNLKPGKYSVAAVLDYGNSEELEGAQMEIEVK